MIIFLLNIGEGDYNQIEKSIQSLVAERAALMAAKETSFDANPTAPIKPGSLYYVDLMQNTTPEIYIGIVQPELHLEILKASNQIRQFHTDFASDNIENRLIKYTYIIYQE